MIFVEIDGILFNPEHVAFIVEHIENGTVNPLKCRIQFSGSGDDFVVVNVSISFAATVLVSAQPGKGNPP